MKSKPEYRHIFSSPRMFFRALHTISTQKYRLPVRRYILDLFTVELDADVVRQLTESAVALQIPLVPLPVEEAEEEGAEDADADGIGEVTVTTAVDEVVADTKVADEERKGEDEVPAPAVQEEQVEPEPEASPTAADNRPQQRPPPTGPLPPVPLPPLPPPSRQSTVRGRPKSHTVSGPGAAPAGRLRESVMVFRQRAVRPPVSESEDEASDAESEGGAAGAGVRKRHRAPVMSLRPKSRIIGFN